MQNIQEAIENELRKTLGEYYNCACRAKVEQLVEEEFKYKCLREWIERELDMGGKLINVFCPADRDKNYTNEQVKIYLENMQKIAVLTHCKLILSHLDTTEEMRKNIEYTLCKLYKIKYNDKLKCYI